MTVVVAEAEFCGLLLYWPVMTALFVIVPAAAAVGVTTMVRVRRGIRGQAAEIEREDAAGRGRPAGGRHEVHVGRQGVGHDARRGRSRARCWSP